MGHMDSICDIHAASGFTFSVRDMKALSGEAPYDMAYAQWFCSEGLSRYRRAASRLAAIFNGEVQFFWTTYEEAVAAYAECEALSQRFEELNSFFSGAKVGPQFTEATKQLALDSFDVLRHFRTVQSWFQQPHIPVQVRDGLHKS